MTDLSRSAALTFLDYLANKGLMNKSTAAARKAAVNQVLGILDEEEASDVSKLDLNDVMRRFQNLAGSKYTPASLGNYKSRVKSALDDFLRYQKDPMSFKPSVQTNAEAKVERPRNASASEPVAYQERGLRAVEAPPASVTVLPIPIRADLTVKIQGLPYDLTAAEANKIASVVKAMAVQD